MDPSNDPELQSALLWNRLRQDFCSDTAKCPPPGTKKKSTYLSGVTRELTEDQTKTIDDLFGLFDHHGVQTIAIEELGTLMRALGQIPTQEQMRQIIEEIDADGNGVMEYYEFVDLMTRLPWGEQGSEEELVDAYHSSFPADDDGRFCAAEFRHIMTSEGEALTDEEVDMLMKQLEPDVEGLVSCQEIIELIMKKPKKNVSC